MNTYTIPLGEEEIKELEELYNRHEKRRVRQRAHMILLSDQGYSLSEIAKIVRVERHVVSNYVHPYEEEGPKPYTMRISLAGHPSCPRNNEKKMPNG